LHANKTDFRWIRADLVYQSMLICSQDTFSGGIRLLASLLELEFFPFFYGTLKLLANSIDCLLISNAGYVVQEVILLHQEILNKLVLTEELLMLPKSQISKQELRNEEKRDIKRTKNKQDKEIERGRNDIYSKKWIS